VMESFAAGPPRKAAAIKKDFTSHIRNMALANSDKAVDVSFEKIIQSLRAYESAKNPAKKPVAGAPATLPTDMPGCVMQRPAFPKPCDCRVALSE
jgi:hypothetical protein